MNGSALVLPGGPFWATPDVTDSPLAVVSRLAAAAGMPRSSLQRLLRAPAAGRRDPEVRRLEAEVRLPYRSAKSSP